MGTGTAFLPGRWARGLGDDGIHTGVIFASDRQAASPGTWETPVNWGRPRIGRGAGRGVCHLQIGAKLNLRRFFQVLGILLMVFAAGFLLMPLKICSNCTGWTLVVMCFGIPRARFQRRRVSATSFIPYSLRRSTDRIAGVRVARLFGPQHNSFHSRG